MGKTWIIVPTAAADIDMLADCLEGCSRYNDASIAVVCNTNIAPDRLSAAGLLGVAEARGRIVRAAFVPERIGYVRAVNIAWGLCESGAGDYIAVINDDLQVTGDFVTPMRAALDAGALQVGPSIKHVGRDGFWGKGDEPFVFAEGWCWMAKAMTLVDASLQAAVGTVYDPQYAIPGYGCDDCDLSIRIIQSVGFFLPPQEAIRQVDNLPVHHLHTQTVRNRDAGWARNRARLVERWHLDAV